MTDLGKVSTWPVQVRIEIVHGELDMMIARRIAIVWGAILLYINDLPRHVSSKANLYADDTLLYRIINTPNDISILQEDLDSLSQWAHKWQMIFNASKCVHLTITRKLSPFPSTYSICNHIPSSRLLVQSILVSH